ncbi:hypothetical protein [Spartinivicinus poritis]|uniref:Uncharacterized protein n=1 Tax=Spartinivicinus poritis TaxID=2994640 RepID=A0ABT5U617_9GAMM|nr:hypothetical protein [Spartinivicinus sp. A2-2]MDE1461625.1 hypothetical protein [Spartinivicinus sp. A2-2]
MLPVVSLFIGGVFIFSSSMVDSYLGVILKVPVNDVQAELFWVKLNYVLLIGLLAYLYVSIVIFAAQFLVMIHYMKKRKLNKYSVSNDSVSHEVIIFFSVTVLSLGLFMKPGLLHGVYDNIWDNVDDMLVGTLYHREEKVCQDVLAKDKYNDPKIMFLPRDRISIAVKVDGNYKFDIQKCEIYNFMKKANS